MGMASSRPEAVLDERPILERLVRRDRVITMAALAILGALAWLYILAGAGMAMSPWETTTYLLFPHRQLGDGIGAMASMSGMEMPMLSDPIGWRSADATLMVGMWWAMMIAMMTPSAAPTVLLHAHVHRQAVAKGRIQSGLAPTGAFVAGYLLIWLAFSVAATVLHGALESWAMVSATSMRSQSRWLSAGVLIAAGLYELSPFKEACLSHCRSPASFLSRHWRPGGRGAIRLGAMHGAYCVGCCWVLMLLLFVGGVMNLLWIAMLTLIVVVEKQLVRGRWFSRVTGTGLLGWGLVTLWA